MGDKKIYKDEDSQIIFEFIKKFREETEERKRFASALERILVKAYYNEQELDRCKNELEYYKDLEKQMEDDGRWKRKKNIKI